MSKFSGCFLTGTAAEVTPVSQIDNYKFSVCNVIKDLSESYQNLVRKKDGSYDWIVPSRGGKDSGYVAHLLKYKYNMNPLTVTWPPVLYTDYGKDNFKNWLLTFFSSEKIKLSKLSKLILEFLQ